MRDHLKALAVASVIMAGTAGYAAFISAAPAQPTAQPGDEAILGAIRRNPHIVLEAIQEIQRRESVAKTAQQSKALADSESQMLDPRTTAFAGNIEGDVTLIEFADYNCGYCKRAAKDVAALIKSDPKLRVALKELPVLGPDSVAASRVATAVKGQLSGSAFLAFHLDLMSQRGKVDAAVATRVAVAHGADAAKLAADSEGAAIKAAVDETLMLAERLGINGTPAFVIGGEVVPGAVGEAALAQKISSVRKCGKSAC